MLEGSLIGADPTINADQNQYSLLFNRVGDDLLITDLENNRLTSYAPAILVSKHFLSRNKIETIRILTQTGKYTSISSEGIDNLVQAMAGINYSTATAASLSRADIVSAINENWKVNSFLA